MENSRIDIPDENAEWDEILKYDLNFNAYEYWDSFEKTAEIANKQLKKYSTKGTLPVDIIKLKTCLFFEKRRYRHMGRVPSDEAMKYIKALIEKIRNIDKEND